MRAGSNLVLGAVTVMLATATASGYAVGPARSLEELATTADLVCKATVVGDRVVTDAWFEPVAGYEVHETELRVISVIKGPSTKLVQFRHYAPAPAAAGMASYSPESYALVTGRSYLVFAAKAGAGYRMIDKRGTSKPHAGVLLAADATPPHGKTITEIALAELRARLAAGAPDDVVDAIVQLDELSGGHMTGLTDFDRHLVLDTVRPLILAKSEVVATAAIAVFGADSPYFDDQLAEFWLAGVGKGTLPGIGGLVPPAHPTAELAVTELGAVANGSGSAALRALAIRVLARSQALPTAKLVSWAHDRDPAVRAGAVLASAELPSHQLITGASTDPAAQVRQVAALAIGFAQDPALLPILDALIKDSAPEVRAAAAMSLLAFAPAQAAAVIKANLGSEFRSLFINALARRDPAPYLPLLAEVIEKQLQPEHWSGGTIPAGDSWTILYGYVKSRPASELVAGKLDRSLDALERMHWYSSSEPRDLYALYLVRGLTARAKQFRAASHKAFTYDIDYYFDMADKSPSTYVP